VRGGERDGGRERERGGEGGRGGEREREREGERVRAALTRDIYASPHQAVAMDGTDAEARVRIEALQGEIQALREGMVR
jgi:hypothetical protein